MLRRKLLPDLCLILSQSERIADSNARLIIQSSCLDLITGLEDVIHRLGLE